MEEGTEWYMFMPHERIKINRCEFRLHGNRYHSYELHNRHGEELIAAYDVHDANVVYVLDSDETLITTAVWNGNSLHGVPTSKKEQALFDRENRRSKNAQRKVDMIKKEDSKPTLVMVREVTPELIAFEAKQAEKQEKEKIHQAGMINSVAELCADIRRRAEVDEASEYEIRWANDYENSFGKRFRLGLYRDDPNCMGRFKEENKKVL